MLVVAQLHGTFFQKIAEFVKRPTISLTAKQGDDKRKSHKRDVEKGMEEGIPGFRVSGVYSPYIMYIVFKSSLVQVILHSYSIPSFAPYPPIR